MRRQTKAWGRSPNPSLRRARSPREECAVVGCRKTTSEHKPYCIDHLDRLAYASGVMKGVAQREAEFARALRGANHVDTTGALATEFLELLEHEGAAVKVESLTGALFDVIEGEGHRVSVAESICLALVRAGLVRISDRYERKRGRTYRVASLTKADEERAA